MRLKLNNRIPHLRLPTLALLAACALLAVYIGFLMAFNYRNQTALRESTLNRLRLDMEKRAASLGYFFSERKYDIRFLASSREIAAYFINKSLGMSEQYGLRLNLFVIEQTLIRTVAEKSIQGDPIYTRFLLVDREGAPLIDTAKKGKIHQATEKWGRYLRKEKSEPAIFIEKGESGTQILLTASCDHNETVNGILIAWLNIDTLARHFVDYSTDTDGKGFDLMMADGRMIFSAGRLSEQTLAAAGIDDLVLQPADADGPPGQAPLFPEGTLVIPMPVHNMPLTLFAWVDRKDLFGAISPAQLLIGTGSLAVVILMGIGVLMLFNTQNLVLKARFDESERQHALLAVKNDQLQREIRKRLEAEKQLEEQRTMRMRSDRLRSLGEMAAGIAHELNQPLMGIQGMAEVLQKAIESGRTPPPEKIRKNVGRIVEQTERMAHIIKHVRLFARDAGKIQTSRTDLNEVARSGIGFLATQLRAHGFELNEDLAPYPMPVEINPFSVEEVVINLISNARDALEQLKTKAVPGFTPRISVRSWSGNTNGKPTAWIEIRDNGPGIPDEIAQKVFDPFFTTKDPDKGTGLGLSISKSIVESFGGAIQFASAQGEGTCFTMSFPESS